MLEARLLEARDKKSEVRSQKQEARGSFPEFIGFPIWKKDALYQLKTINYSLPLYSSLPPHKRI